MIRYELINPSDAYTFEAQNELVAACAVILVGEGRYGAKAFESDEPETQKRIVAEDLQYDVPVWLFAADAAVNKWFELHGTKDWSSYIVAHAKAVADCLDSFVIGSFEERRRLERLLSVISNEDERGKAWHDERRSSMNDIGSFAKHRAERLRALPPIPEPT
jgi:hypothetical protein